VRGLVFINPGNPTGQCLSRDNLEGLIKFAYDERVVLMCDRAALHLSASWSSSSYVPQLTSFEQYLHEPAPAQVR